MNNYVIKYGDSYVSADGDLCSDQCEAIRVSKETADTISAARRALASVGFEDDPTYDNYVLRAVKLTSRAADQS